MSWKDDLRGAVTGIPPSPEAVEMVESGLPVVMITLADSGVYVSDQRLSKWEKVAEYRPKSGLR
jgi:hypothetical protein